MPEIKLRLERITDNGQTTIGRLYVDGVFACHTLEDTRRFYELPQDHPNYSPKVYGETCIAAGLYSLSPQPWGRFYEKYKARFRKIGHKSMIAVDRVLGFTGILMHCGNRHKDTHGCILLGRKLNDDFISASGTTYARVYSMIYDAVTKGRASIEIIDVPEGGGGRW